MLPLRSVAAMLAAGVLALVTAACLGQSSADDGAGMDVAARRAHQGDAAVVGRDVQHLDPGCHTARMRRERGGETERMHACLPADSHRTIDVAELGLDCVEVLCVAVACFPAYPTNELVVVCGEGRVVRVPQLR